LTWLTQFPALYDPTLLVLRLTVGLMFAMSGYYKLTKAARGKSMRDTLQSAGLPRPLAPPLAALEAVAGAMLAMGLLTALSALALFGISIVAFATTTLPNAKGEGIHRLENLLYAPEAVLSATLLVLLATGAGGWSLDRVVFG